MRSRSEGWLYCPLWHLADLVPCNAYGYIRQGSIRSDGAFKFEDFTEKPAQKKAEVLLLSGSVFLNTSIFLCSAQTLLSALSQQAPDILQACR